MKTLLSVLISTFLSISISAQTVSGKLIDENSQPLPYANVVLLSLPDSTFVTGTISGEDGSFTLEATSENQIVRISSIGYMTAYRPVSPANIGIVQLVSDAQMLGEVVIKGNLPVTRMKGDAMITGVAGTALEKAGTAEQMLDKIKSGEVKHLPVIIKADVQGSIEAIEGTITKLSNDEVSVQILHSAVGPISDSDVTLAKASNAFIIGFNVRAIPHARDMARQDGVDIRYYSIIYDVADDIKKALEGMLSPELKEKILGYAEIRNVFNITGVGKVAGCMVTEGLVKRGAKVRLLRDNVVIHDGALGQLKRFKDDVKEVKDGYECGMSFENYNDIQVGDFIECYEIESIAAKL